MTDRPILFSAPMVRALLAGTKTQTRRVINPQPELLPSGLWHVHNRHGGLVGVAEEDIPRDQIDYLRISVGDRLYVREAWRPGYNAEGWREDLGRVARPSDFDPVTTAIEYLADGTNELGGDDRPGIHMPRWASRITLHVTDVRVQWLQDINEADAIAEGITPSTVLSHCWRTYAETPRPFNGEAPTVLSYGRGVVTIDPRHSYATLLDHLHGAGFWDTNPWVAAYTFTVEQANIDQARAA